MTQGVLEDDSEGLVSRAGERVLHIGRDRPIRISAGHRLMHHDGKCSRPHGHNYEISVRLVGELTEEGWVVDKGEVTAIIDEWDHMFLLEDGDPLVEAFADAGDADATVVLDAPPTAEVMSVLLEEKLSAALPDTVRDVAVEVSETSELCGGELSEAKRTSSDSLRSSDGGKEREARRDSSQAERSDGGGL